MEYEKLWFSLLEYISSDIHKCQEVDRYSVSLSNLYKLDSKEDTLREIETFMTTQMDLQRCSGDSK